MLDSTPLPDESIAEAELRTLSESGKISKMRLVETADGFYVVAVLPRSVSKFLSTFRVKDKPRLFHDLQRLNDFIRSVFPCGVVEMVCQQKYTPVYARSKAERKARKKKTAVKKKATTKIKAKASKS